MLWYIVSVAVDRERAAEWAAWMADLHIPEVVATGHFAGAWMSPDAARDTPERQAWRMVYLVKSQQDFEDYQRDDAPALQADHTTRFGGVASASREVLPITAAFAP